MTRYYQITDQDGNEVYCEEAAGLADVIDLQNTPTGECYLLTVVEMDEAEFQAMEETY
jgi:hypothetical protein